MAMKFMTIERRLTRNTVKTNNCWYWKGYKNMHGYGLIVFTAPKSQTKFAHRVAYEVAYGPFDPSLYVLHKCDTPSCVNPEHLYLGTQSDNMKECSVRGRTGGIKAFRIITPDEEIIEGRNIAKFCRDYGLNKQSMRNLVAGKKRQYRGYKVAAT